VQPPPSLSLPSLPPETTPSAPTSAAHSSPSGALPASQPALLTAVPAPDRPAPPPAPPTMSVPPSLDDAPLAHRLRSGRTPPLSVRQTSLPPPWRCHRPFRVTTEGEGRTPKSVPPTHPLIEFFNLICLFWRSLLVHFVVTHQALVPYGGFFAHSFTLPWRVCGREAEGDTTGRIEDKVPADHQKVLVHQQVAHGSFATPPCAG